jgi:hypothetical protein
MNATKVALKTEAKFSLYFVREMLQYWLTPLYSYSQRNAEITAKHLEMRLHSVRLHAYLTACANKQTKNSVSCSFIIRSAFRFGITDFIRRPTLDKSDGPDDEGSKNL